MEKLNVLLYSLIFILFAMIATLVVIMKRRASLAKKRKSSPVPPNPLKVQAEISGYPYKDDSMVINLLFTFYLSYIIFKLAKSIKINDPIDYNNIRICGILLCLIFIIFLLHDFIKKLKPFLLYDTITSSVENVPGKIIYYCEMRPYHRHSGSGLPRSNYYYLVIKYNDIYTGEEKILVTPCLKFNPSYTLATDECTIYYYKNIILAADFKPYFDTSTTPVFLEQNNSYLKYTPDSKFTPDAFLIITAILAFIMTVALFYFIMKNSALPL